MNTTKLINKINNFNYYYEMQSCNKIYDEAKREEKEINQELEGLSSDQLSAIKKGLTVSSEDLKRYFSDRFENLRKEESTHSTVFKTAWTMLKDGLFFNISEALTAAWKRIKLIKSLKSGIAFFAYVKATGELREAIGTLRQGNFSYEPKTIGKDGKVHVIKYFDLEVKAFRSCRVDRLITVQAA